MTVLRAHAHSIRAHVHNIGQRLSRVLIIAVMAALAVAMFASPSRAADQTWSDVSTTINGLIDEGVSTFKAGDAKGGKDQDQRRLLQALRDHRHGEAGHGPHLRLARLAGGDGVLPPEEGHE